MRHHAPLALAILLSATTAGAQPQKPINLNTFNDRLVRLSPDNQRAAMRQAVTNNGLRCGRVETARMQEAYRNLVMWTVRCTPGGDYGVFIGRDGSAQARPCADLAALKLPVCRMAPPAARPAARRPR